MYDLLNDMMPGCFGIIKNENCLRVKANETVLKNYLILKIRSNVFKALLQILVTACGLMSQLM